MTQAQSFTMKYEMLRKRYMVRQHQPGTLTPEEQQCLRDTCEHALHREMYTRNLVSALRNLKRKADPFAEYADIAVFRYDRDIGEPKRKRMDGNFIALAHEQATPDAPRPLYLVFSVNYRARTLQLLTAEGTIEQLQYRTKREYLQLQRKQPRNGRWQLRQEAVTPLHALEAIALCTAVLKHKFPKEDTLRLDERALLLEQQQTREAETALRNAHVHAAQELVAHHRNGNGHAAATED